MRILLRLNNSQSKVTKRDIEFVIATLYVRAMKGKMGGKDTGTDLDFMITML